MAKYKNQFKMRFTCNRFAAKFNQADVNDVQKLKGSIRLQVQKFFHGDDLQFLNLSTQKLNKIKLSFDIIFFSIRLFFPYFCYILFVPIYRGSCFITRKFMF